jgi:DNA-binding transcriptional LysR family regulator
MFRELFQQSGLSFERLRTFCLVAEAGGVTRAAGGDPNMQSLFSRQIKELEEYFGVELVRRSGRGVVLTDSGEHLSVIAREHLTALADFKAVCSQAPLKLAIGAGDSLVHWLLLPKLARLKKRLQNVHFVFLNLKSAEITKRLIEGTLDFGLVRETGVLAPLKTVGLGILRHALFVPQSLDAPADLKQILSRFPIATLEGDGTFRRELTAAFKKHGSRLEIQVECSSFPLVARALRTHTAVAVLPTLASSDFELGSFTTINAPLLRQFDRKIVLAWNTRMSRIRSVVEKSRAIIAEEMKF